MDSVFARLSSIAGSVEAEYTGIFGSSARNEAEPGSDLDLLVLVRTPEAGERAHDALVGAAADLENRFGLRLSPVVLTVDQARKQTADSGSFLSTVQWDLRRVYGPGLEELING